jgi:hypothetical protein
MSARVKHFSSTLLHALEEERHFALMDGVAFPTVGSLVIVFQVRNSVRPMHLFGHTRDHDYYFELPGEGSGIPNQLLGVRERWSPRGSKLFNGSA